MDNNILENEQPIEQPVEQSVEQPVEQPIEQPIEQPVEQPVEQSIEQPETQPVEQPAAQPTIGDFLEKGKELLANSAPLVEKGKELTGSAIAKGKELTGSAVEKGKELLKNSGPAVEKVKSLPKKLWIALGAGVAALIVLIAVLLSLGNTYKTPIQSVEKLLNMKSIEKIIDNAPSLLNGFGTAEAKKALKIVKKSEVYDDAMEEAEEYFDEAIEMVKDEYGNNYKIKIKVEDKEKLEKEDVREFRDMLREVGEYKDDLKDLDSDDIEDIADEFDLKKSQVKDLINLAEDFCKKCKSAKVSAGYALDLVISIDGSEADEPQEMELSVRVFKVDGKWILDVFTVTEELGSAMSLISMFY